MENLGLNIRMHQPSSSANLLLDATFRYASNQVLDLSKIINPEVEPIANKANSEENEDDVTHEEFFGENIKRAIKIFSKK